MEWFVRAFMKASLAWLGLGVTLGVAVAALRAHAAWAARINALVGVALVVAAVWLSRGG